MDSAYVNSYLESETARSSSSVYVKGEVNNGLCAGKTYTLYAYAQAANGTWYLAGSDDITMEDGGEADLRIDRITEYTDVDEFKVGEEVEFKVRIENRGNAKSSDHILKVYDEDGKLLDDNYENELDAGDYHNAYLYVTINKPGRQRLKFYISGGESEDRIEYRTYTWNNNFVDMRLNSVRQKEKGNKIIKVNFDVSGIRDGYGRYVEIVAESPLGGIERTARIVTDGSNQTEYISVDNYGPYRVYLRDQDGNKTSSDEIIMLICNVGSYVYTEEHTISTAEEIALASGKNIAVTLACLGLTKLIAVGFGISAVATKIGKVVITVEDLAGVGVGSTVGTYTDVRGTFSLPKEGDVYKTKVKQLSDSLEYTFYHYNKEGELLKSSNGTITFAEF